MRFLQYHFPVAIIILIAVIVAGCGGTTGTTTTPTPTATPTSIPTPTPSPTPQPTATPTPVNALIHTGQVTVNGTVKTVLTNAAGKTLYYLTADTPTTTAWSTTATSCTPSPETLLLIRLMVKGFKALAAHGTWSHPPSKWEVATLGIVP